MLYRVRALGSEDLLVTGNSTIEAYHGIIKALILDVLKCVPHALLIRVLVPQSWYDVSCNGMHVV